MATTTATLNIAGGNLTVPLTAEQNTSIVNAVNSSLSDFPGITSIRIGDVQVLLTPHIIGLLALLYTESGNAILLCAWFL